MVRKRKKKFSTKKFLRFFIPLIIILTIFLYKDDIYTLYVYKTTSYSDDTINVIKDNNLDINILNKKYSQTLENIINTEYFDVKHVDDYLEINYLDRDNFSSNISKLLSLNYTPKEINTIYDKLSDESIDIIINNDYLSDLIDIINLSYFKEDLLERYIEYILKNDYEIETAIIYVNIGLDKEYYTNVSEISDQDDILVLVNKYHKLSENYVPDDLKTISAKYQWAGRSNALRKEASDAFEKMCEAATKDDIYIYAGSGYRSYATQLYLYNNYVLQDGFAAAETYSARASYSEHQTGLAMDIANKNGFISESDKEYKWLIDNSYKYGFILRYPKGKENITGYMYEEWHYRYVGIDVAKEVYESGLTYDEYVAKK